MGKEAKVGIAVISILAITLTTLLVRRFTSSNDLPAAEVLATSGERVAGFDLPAADEGRRTSTVTFRGVEAPRLEANESTPPTPNDWKSEQSIVEDVVAEMSQHRLSFMPRVEIVEVEAEQEQQASQSEAAPGATVIQASAATALTPVPATPISESEAAPGSERYSVLVEEAAPAVTQVAQPEENPIAEDPLGRSFGVGPVGPIASENRAPNREPVAPQVASQIASPAPEAEPARFAPTNYQEPATNAVAQTTPYRQQTASNEGYRQQAATPAENYQAVPPAIARRNDWQTAQRETPRSGYPAPAQVAAASRVGTGATSDSRQQEYVVKPNDNMWKISTKIYGTGAYFRALVQHNSRWLENPKQLRIGDKVRTPSVMELAQKYPDLCPKQRRSAGEANRIATVGVSRTGPTRQYRVRESDTLFDIARFELGEASRWVEIYDLNKGVLTEDFNYLPPGTVLKLPIRKAPEHVDTPDTLTQQPDGTIRQ